MTALYDYTVKSPRLYTLGADITFTNDGSTWSGDTTIDGTNVDNGYSPISFTKMDSTFYLLTLNGPTSVPSIYSSTTLNSWTDITSSFPSQTNSFPIDTEFNSYFFNWNSFYYFGYVDVSLVSRIARSATVGSFSNVLAGRLIIDKAKDWSAPFLYFVDNASGEIHYTSNGTSSTSTGIVGTQYCKAFYENGTYFILTNLADSGTFALYTSTNGTSFTSQTIPTITNFVRCLGVGFNNNVYYYVVISGTEGTTTIPIINIVTSSNLTSWTNSSTFNANSYPYLGAAGIPGGYSNFYQYSPYSLGRLGEFLFIWLPDISQGDNGARVFLRYNLTTGQINYISSAKGKFSPSTSTPIIASMAFYLDEKT